MEKEDKTAVMGLENETGIKRIKKEAEGGLNKIMTVTKSAMKKEKGRF